MDETFEQWWAKNWKSDSSLLEAAFKELAKKAWEAADAAGYERGHDQGWIDGQDSMKMAGDY